MGNSFFDKFIIGEWNLGVCNTNFIEEFSKINEGGTLQLHVKWMRHSHSASFFADPFIYKVTDNTAEILAEEYLFTKKKGVISLCTIDRCKSKLLKCTRILEETCHLSYPVFDPERSIIVPESFRNGNWSSYDFDGKKISNKSAIISDGLIDATPVFWEGYWYVFYTKQPKALSELYIYYSDSLYGNYKLHPLNPIKDDLRSGRCGGKFFSYEGCLYRVVQDSSKIYGGALHIMKVNALSPTEYNESYYCDIEVISDGKYNLGVHTLNFSDDFIIVDGYRERHRPLFAIYIHKILPFFKRIFK